MRDTLFNIDPTEADGDALAACDAYESRDPRAMGLLVGLPATIQVGSDSYAARVVKITPKTITAEYANSGRQMTFRPTRGGYWTNSTRYLQVGAAIQKWDEGF